MGKVVAVLTGRAQDSIPDIAALKAAMKKSLENEDKTVTLDQIEAVVEFQVEQSFTFPAGVLVNENFAKKAAASTFSVDEVNVAVMISQVRRLRGETGRRLAGIRVDAIIKTNDAEKADTMKATGADTSAVATAFATNFATAYNADPTYSGNAISPPTITAAAPSLAMEVTYKIVSTSATGGVVDPPAATNLKAEFTNQGGNLATVSSTMTVATPAPTSPPTMMPTPLPAGGTHAPTSMPTTSMPTPMPPTPAPPTPAPPADTPAPPTPAPAPDTPMNTTTPAPAPKGGESAAFPTKVAGCVAIVIAATLM